MHTAFFLQAGSSCRCGILKDLAKHLVSIVKWFPMNIIQLHRPHSCTCCNSL